MSVSRGKRTGWDPNTAQRGLQWGDLNEPEQAAVEGQMSLLGEEMDSRMSTLADSVQVTRERAEARGADDDAIQPYRSKENRLRSGAEDVIPGPVHLDQAARRRADDVEQGTLSRSLPHEDIVGGRWYFDHNRAMGSIEGIETERAIAVGGVVSEGVAPDEEIAAVQDIVRTGTTTRTSSKGVIKRAQEVMKMEDPTKALDPARNPKTYAYSRATMAADPNSPEGMEYEVRTRHLGRVIRGEEDPRQGTLALFGDLSPRAWASDDEHASPSERASAREWDRQNRAVAAMDHAYETVEGEAPPQPLNPLGDTAQDTWARAETFGDHFPTPAYRKAAGDINIKKRETVTDPETGETEQRRIEGMHPSASSDSLRHAWENEADRRAGEILQERHQTDFRVTPGMVQPSWWTAQKRSVPSLRSEAARQPGTFASLTGDAPASTDSRFNEHLRQREKQRKAEAKTPKEKTLPAFTPKGNPKRDLRRQGTPWSPKNFRR